MRRARLKVPWEGFYHVVSRIGGRRFLLDAGEKKVLLGTIRSAAEFSGVEVLAYALMDNHFHLLVRVPPKEEVDDEEFARRIGALYGDARRRKLFGQWEKWEAKGNGARVTAAKQGLRTRMNELSQFCKTFKETYTQRYNARTGNTGTIWEGRFKSVLLKGDYRTLMTVAAYIHLNPVRAGVVEEAAAAQNTSYGAACAGDREARWGLASLLAFARGGGASDWVAARRACEEAVAGAEGQKGDETVQVRVSTPSMGNGENGLAEEAESPTISDLLRKRCVAFLHGGALGDAEFLGSLAGLVPPRRRRRHETVLDRSRDVGLLPVYGVRDSA